MKFVRYEKNREIFVGVEKNSRVLSFKDMGMGYEDLYDFIDRHSKSDLEHIKAFDFSKAASLEDVYLLAPLESTRRDIMCIGINYQAHKDESMAMLTEDEIKADLPVYFPKRAAYINGPRDDIRSRLDLDEAMDYECELALVISKEGRDIKESEALDYVFGYTILNDLSSRRLQRAYGQWYKGKSLDSYTVMGPGIVPASEIEDPQDLGLRTWINGELRQDSSTKYMLRKIPTLIAELSSGMTLFPGDIIATGTPEGVGQGFEPPKFLKKEDIIVMEIDSIGRLENTVI